LEELVQAVLVKYLRRTMDVAIQYLEWHDMTPRSDYQNFEENKQKTLRKICLFVQRYGRKNISLMKIPNLRS